MQNVSENLRERVIQLLADGFKCGTATVIHDLGDRLFNCRAQQLFQLHADIAGQFCSNIIEPVPDRFTPEDCLCYVFHGHVRQLVVRYVVSTELLLGQHDIGQYRYTVLVQYKIFRGSHGNQI